MLERVLEPEVMDSIQEALAYDAMDHSQVNCQFAADLLAAGCPEGDILDLGTGTALIPIELCRFVEGRRVLAVDMSADMLDVARNNVEMSGFGERIVLDRVDAKALPYEDGRFTAVISNSIVHHLPHPQPALAEAVRVVCADGLLFFRDLCRPAADEEINQLVEQYAGGEAEEARQMFSDSLRAALTVSEMQALVTALGFHAGTVQSTSDRHWTWTARTPR